MSMTERTLTPADFLDVAHCRWFRLSKATAGPDLRFGCSMCGTISKTQECPAFRDGPSKTIIEGAKLLEQYRRAAQRRHPT